jgi:uncharacterized membrane protein
MNRGLLRTLLLDLNLFLGFTAVAGGVALLVGWIKIPLSSLAGSPFSDYTVPAALLAVVIGGSAMLAARLVHLGNSLGLPASAIAGGAIIVFEIVEWSVIGFAWLQAAYMAIGVLIVSLAVWILMAQVRGRVPRRLPPHAAH